MKRDICTRAVTILEINMALVIDNCFRVLMNFTKGLSKWRIFRLCREPLRSWSIGLFVTFPMMTSGFLNIYLPKSI